MPVNGTTYNEGDAIGNGLVVTTTSATSFMAQGLAAGTTYYFFIFSVNNACTGGPLYKTDAPLTGSAGTTSPPACATPTGIPGVLMLTPANTSISGSFADATGADGYLVVRSTNSSLSFTPGNGTSYTNGQTVGADNSGIVTKYAAGNTFAATGLSTNTVTYDFYVYAVSGFTCTGGPLYNTTARTGSAATSNSNGIPVGYYDTVTTQSCAPLKSTLKWRTTTGMAPKTYGELWNQFNNVDIKPREVTYNAPNNTANVIWDIYSDVPNGTDPYNFTATPSGGFRMSCSGYSGANVEGDCYNREHSVPQSWFGASASNASAGPESDFHHIFPTDRIVNAERGNYIYGEVANATYTSQNGSKKGSSAMAGFTDGTIVFEPLNEYKGDVARAFLYFVTRYEENMTGWPGGTEGGQAFDPTTYPSVDVPYLKLMLKWHTQDPVSQKEIDRNNAAYAYQSNRNPFVDHPEYVDRIWNSNCPGLAALPVNMVFFGGKLHGNKVSLEWIAENEVNFARFDVERSFNGIHYSKIGQVNASNARNYSYNDNADAITGRRVYYRLKKIDKDGNYKYSDVFTLHIPSNVKFNLYPNPASNYTKVQFSSNVAGKVTLQVTDMLGSLLQQQTIAVNQGSFQLNTTSLSTGTYIVKMVYNGETYLQKLIVTK